MLLSLGLGSQIGILEGMLCTIFDIEIFKRMKKQYVTGAVCLFCFLVGLIFTTGAGEYWLKMFDSFAGTIGLVVVALMEMISVIYIYGHVKFTEDIYQMTGYRPGWYWQLTWRYIGPAIMVCILISSVIVMVIQNPKYGAWNGELVIITFLLIYIIYIYVFSGIYLFFFLKKREWLLKWNIQDGLWV